MKEPKNWIIVDLKKATALYGINKITLMFSTSDIAVEVARQLFEKQEDYIVVHIQTEKIF